MILRRIVGGRHHDRRLLLPIHLRVVQEGSARQADASHACTLVDEARRDRAVQLGGMDPGVMPDEEAFRLHVARQCATETVGERKIDSLTPDAAHIVCLEYTHTDLVSENVCARNSDRRCSGYEAEATPIT